MFRLCVLIIKSHCANVPKSEYMDKSRLCFLAVVRQRAVDFPVNSKIIEREY